MQMKNIKKLLLNTITTAVLGAVAGSLLTYFTQAIINKMSFNVIYLFILFTILSLVLAFLIFQKIESADEVKYKIVSDMCNGFIKIDKDMISDFATTLVKKSSFIRVVGTARQDVLSKKINHSARNYLSVLESKMSKVCNTEGDAFTYLRVVPSAPHADMETHIDKCIQSSRDTCNCFAVVKMDIFDFYISYQIFDDTDLLLIVDNQLHGGDNDNDLCLWTKDKDIIKTFINRFDAAWQHQNSQV